MPALAHFPEVILQVADETLTQVRSTWWIVLLPGVVIPAKVPVLHRVQPPPLAARALQRIHTVPQNEAFSVGVVADAMRFFVLTGATVRVRDVRTGLVVHTAAARIAGYYAFLDAEAELLPVGVYDVEFSLNATAEYGVDIAGPRPTRLLIGPARPDTPPGPLVAFEALPPVPRHADTGVAFALGMTARRVDGRALLVMAAEAVVTEVVTGAELMRFDARIDALTLWADMPGDALDVGTYDVRFEASADAGLATSQPVRLFVRTGAPAEAPAARVELMANSAPSGSVGQSIAAGVTVARPDGGAYVAISGLVTAREVRTGASTSLGVATRDGAALSVAIAPGALPVGVYDLLFGIEADGESLPVWPVRLLVKPDPAVAGSQPVVFRLLPPTPHVADTSMAIAMSIEVTRSDRKKIDILSAEAVVTRPPANTVVLTAPALITGGTVTFEAAAGALAAGIYDVTFTLETDAGDVTSPPARLLIQPPPSP